tara:strand:+ start:721 stop:1296 length:576 start_codon:yes stop_codon:yes gene_type:complete
MEILRMAPNRFTLILLGMLVLFAVMVKPAHARNEYLNNNTQACQYGSFDVQTSYGQQDTEYNHYSPNNNYDNYGRNKEIRFTFRKYLGVSKEMCDKQNAILLENEDLRQELEMLKVCNKYADRPLPPQFATVEKHCKGLRARPERAKSDESMWDEMKKDYIEDNPDVDLFDNSKPGLKLPPKDFILPEPKP